MNTQEEIARRFASVAMSVTKEAMWMAKERIAVDPQELISVAERLVRLDGQDEIAQALALSAKAMVYTALLEAESEVSK